MKEKITYNEALQELREIISEMEHSQIDVDTLEDKVKRASELLKFCKDKLFTTEEKVLDTLKKIDPVN